jgi:diguanylate cyclase (GGDEF)-like protein
MVISPAVKGVKLLTLLGPAVSFVFTVTFVCVWSHWRKFRYLLWLAVGFLLYSLGALTQILLLPRDIGANTILSVVLYISAVLVMIEGFLKRLRSHSNYLLNTVLSVLLISGNSYFYYVHRDLRTRIYTENFIVGLLFLTAAIRIGRIAKKPIDRVLFWVVLIFGLHFFPRTILSITYLPNDSSVATFGQSSYWIWLNFTLVIFLLLLGITLLATVVTDIIDDLKHRAYTDSLTGLLNRRGFEETAMERIADGTRHPFSLIACDIDHFKKINDSYGHAGGDAVLKGVSKLFRDSVRISDTVGRIGGEEFVLLLSNSDRWEAYALAERLRGKLESVRFGKGALRQKMITASFGVTEYRVGESLDLAIRRADEMLYAAKRNGRNRTFADDLHMLLIAESETVIT